MDGINKDNIVHGRVSLFLVLLGSKHDIVLITNNGFHDSATTTMDGGMQVPVSEGASGLLQQTAKAT